MNSPNVLNITMHYKEKRGIGAKILDDIETPPESSISHLRLCTKLYLGCVF